MVPIGDSCVHGGERSSKEFDFSFPEATDKSLKKSMFYPAEYRTPFSR